MSSASWATRVSSTTVRAQASFSSRVIVRQSTGGRVILLRGSTERITAGFNCWSRPPSRRPSTAFGLLRNAVHLTVSEGAVPLGKFRHFGVRCARVIVGDVGARWSPAVIWPSLTIGGALSQ